MDGWEASLYQILQILSVTLFEKTPILPALRKNLMDPLVLLSFDENASPVPWPVECG
jgi:hypothetical protein